jgi:hypothetical protein
VDIEDPCAATRTILFVKITNVPSLRCCCCCIRYLISVRPQDAGLVQSHAGWVLQADPEAGLELLLAMDPPLQYTLVLPLLEVRKRAGG